MFPFLRKFKNRRGKQPFQPSRKLEPSGSGDDNYASLFEVDHVALATLVKGMKYGNLRDKFDGVHGVICVLKSDERNGIKGNFSDLDNRTKMFGSNVFNVKEKNDSFFLSYLVNNPYFNVWFPSAITLSIKLRIILDEFDKAGVKIIRDGVQKCISVHNVVVGDIVFLQEGDQIPADGLFIDGDSLQVKNAWNTREEVDKDSSPFMLFGWKVSYGWARMIVTCVGENTSWTRTLNQGTPNKPLQSHFQRLLLIKEAFSLFSVLVIPSVLIVRFSLGRETKLYGVSEMLLAGISIMVKYAVNNHHYAFWLKIDQSYKRWKGVDVAPTKVVSDMFDWIAAGMVTTIFIDQMNIDTKLEIAEFRLNDEIIINLASEIPPNVFQGLSEGIYFNLYSGDTCLVHQQLQSWGKFELGINFEELEQNYSRVRHDYYSEGLIWIYIKKKHDAGHEKARHIGHCLGDAMVVLSKCLDYYTKDGAKRPLDKDRREKMKKVIQDIKDKGLECFALAHKNVVQGVGSNGESEAKEDVGEKEMVELQETERKEEKVNIEKNAPTLLGIVSFRREARKTVESLQNMGVNVKMVSLSDDISKAKAFANECGIVSPNQNVVVTAKTFQTCFDQNKREMVNKICAMVGSELWDKLLLVEYLKRNNEVVAFIGSEEYDIDVLEEADVGIWKGSINNKEAIDRAEFSIPGKHLSSVLKLLKCTRSYYYYLITLIQLQLFAKMAVFILNFVAAVFSGKTYISDFTLLFLDTVIPHSIHILTSGEPLTKEQLKKFHVGGRKATTIMAMVKKPIIQASLLTAMLLPLHFLTGEIIFGETKTDFMIAILSLAQMFNIFLIVMKKKCLFKVSSTIMAMVKRPKIQASLRTDLFMFAIVSIFLFAMKKEFV